MYLLKSSKDGDYELEGFLGKTHPTPSYHIPGARMRCYSMTSRMAEQNRKPATLRSSFAEPRLPKMAENTFGSIHVALIRKMPLSSQKPSILCFAGIGTHLNAMYIWQT